MQEPKISIIIPVYNAAEHLAPCLEGLLTQTLGDIEIICVDDGSRDSSLEVLNSFAARDSRIKLLSQQNRGCGGARNSGLDRATGDYILFIDADDYVEGDYCQRMYEAAERHSADVVVVGMKKVYAHYTKDRFVVEREAVYSSPQQKFEAVDCPRIFYVMNKLFRRESLQRLSLRFEESVCYEDVMFLARVFCEMGDLVTIPDVYYMYVNQSTGITKSRQTPKKQQDKYIAHKAFVDYCAEHGIDIPSKFKSVTVRFWSFFGITTLKVKERGDRRTWRLFDLIPIYSKKI